MNGLFFTRMGQERLRELDRQAARAAERRDRQMPLPQPTTPSGDLSSLMTLAAVAAWMREPYRGCDCRTACEGGC